MKTYLGGFSVFALGVLLGATGCGPAAGDTGAPDAMGEDVGANQAPVAFGVDDRQDVHAHGYGVLRARARQSTVALMSPGDLNMSNPGNVTFNAHVRTLRVRENLCATERFLDDPAVANCSGTLIDDDLVLTAGHCLNNDWDCANTRFVFKFYRTSASTMELITTQDIFSCQSLVVRQYGTTPDGRTLDYAIARLDRSAVPRFAPAPVRLEDSPLSTGQRVAVIGASSHIPFKIDSGGLVRTTRSSTLDYFVTNSDVFAGNSGSAVYELSDSTVAGIVVTGDRNDYRANGSCNVVNVCTETTCAVPRATYVRRAIESLCAVAPQQKVCRSLRPLKLYWNLGAGDNYSTSTAAGDDSAIAADYNFIRAEAYVFSTPQPGTVPLQQYWSAARGDNFITATSVGEQSAISAGYTFARLEGYVYPTPQPGTVPLKLYWSAQHGDNFTTATASGEQDALSAGYNFVRVEGYVFPAP